MTQEAVALWVQVAAVLVAVGASIVALVVSSLDRKTARGIAAKDRQTSVRQGALMFELEALTRLLNNLRRGGSTDDETRAALGAEAAALIAVIGSERLPLNWRNRINKSADELRDFVGDESKQEWLRRAAEAQIALADVGDELRRLMSEKGAE